MSASGMPPGYQLVEARTAAQFEAARSLIEEYAAHLRTLMGVDLCFQNLSAELRSLPVMYGAPSGCLLLASRGREWLGCCALRRFDADVCEIDSAARRPVIGRAGQRIHQERDVSHRTRHRSRRVLTPADWDDADRREQSDGGLESDTAVQ